MNNYSCYTKDFRENHKLKPFETRFESIRFNSGFIGLSKLDHRGKELIRESISYRSALEEKRNYFSRTDNKRIFISHKIEDKAIALSLAKRLEKNGISYWLDIIDPQFSHINNTPSANTSIAIANSIELALLNCTDMVAIVTNKSYNCQWIPYAYGRIKEPKLQIDDAIFMTNKLTKPIPEYMYLGKIVTTEVSVVASLTHYNTQNFLYSPPKNAFASA